MNKTIGVIKKIKVNSILNINAIPLLERKEEPKYTVTFKNIKDAVCQHYSMNFEHINVVSREEIFRVPRQTIMYFSKEFRIGSLAYIGSLFVGKNGYKDHATIIHAHKKIKDSVFMNRKAELELQEIKELIISKAKQNENN